jgi:hypothetical protein
VRSDDGERYYTAPPCYRGKTNWRPKHIRTIFLTTVAKVRPICISSKKKLGSINIIYTFMMFIFGFCDSKDSNQTTRIRTYNYSTWNSNASNKNLPIITRDLEEKPCALKFKVVKTKATQNVSAISDAHLQQRARNWRQKFQKIFLACSQEELQTVMSNLLSQWTNLLLLMKVTRQMLHLKNRTPVYLYQILSELRPYLDVIISSPVLVHLVLWKYNTNVSVFSAPLCMNTVLCGLNRLPSR